MYCLKKASLLLMAVSLSSTRPLWSLRSDRRWCRYTSSQSSRMTKLTPPIWTKEARTCFSLQHTQHCLFVVIWCQTHGREPLSERRKEGNVLFNDALNTFYLRLYGVRHMVKYHTDSERGNPLTPHGLLFPINRHDSTYHSLSD